MRMIVLQLVPELLEPLGGAGLARIGRQLARGQTRMEEGERPFRCRVLVSDRRWRQWSAAPHRRSTIIFLISPIALAGLRPFGQVRVQFMIVWQR